MGRQADEVVSLLLMRIAGFFIRTLFTLGILAALVYFLGGQLWMAIGLRGFLAEMRDLQTAKLNTASYAKQCQNAPGSSSLSVPLAVQLRFIDESQYAIELRCTLIEESPVHLSKGTLPLFVTKVAGASGFYIDLKSPTTSTITLKSFAATKTFTLDTKSEFVNADASIETYPATTCGGWGYMCCNQDQEKGVGKSQDAGVTDCSANCFSACKSIPYIQSFITDPYPYNGNIVRMDAEQLTVTFSYTVSNVSAESASIHIDYGDGTSDDSTQATGSFVHTYACSGPCENVAVLTATDAQGNSSVVNDSSTIYIRRE